ncbi:hypothetical protein [Marinoscillum sp. MHG1-6]|uniref:hypothetical protein n=1 Tax=Marinoscillum sp. MHG1-6 TaxID=2959627 RepID=UPI002157F121|nr:hypothetical protein [Marinoscillum sp. MHG1-6]
MPGFQLINFKGKEIAYVDYRNQKENEMIAIASDLRQWLIKEGRPHLRLVNISEAYATQNFNKVIRQMGEETKHIPFKGAIVGVTGGKKALLLIYNRILGGKLKPFDTEEEAKAYLVG